jgi:hypothetical protein
MSGASDLIKEMRKQTYKDPPDRTGFFCTICGEEQRNAQGLVHFTSDETVKALNVCHDCLPEWFE